jgi:LAS superfamily LD-carboxypeptidase LdcB
VRRRHRLLAAAVAVAALLAGVPATASGQDPGGQSLEDLRRQRQEVQAREAAQAGTVNALQADSAEAQAALAALNADVRAQQDRVEEAERAVATAEAEQAAAEAAQARAQGELDTVKVELRSSAVDAYVSMGNQRTVSASGVRDVNDALNKRTLLEFQAAESADLIEDYRTIQDDLAVQRALAAEAAERARAKRVEVANRMEELRAAQARQRDFVAQLEQRVDAALAEAQALQSVDAQLAASIQTKEAEIARAIAAQRAADEARAAARAAANRQAFDTAAPADTDSFTPPTIVGSGEIVSVGGIQVHQSIAANLQAMLSAAAADGVPLSGSGYRDASRQVELRRQHCGSSSYAIYQASASSCSPPTARPGSSMHERGLAVDFRDGGSALTRSSAGFRWLQANAAGFGFFNLPSEPWHWSTTGQ